MSKVTDLQGARDMINLASGGFGAGSAEDLLIAINKALSVGAPVGSPDTIRERAKAYSTTAAAYSTASGDLAKVAADQLPNAWSGAVAEHAAQSVQALSNELGVSQQTLAQAAQLLSSWADDLSWAQSTDAKGVTSLQSAYNRAQAEFFSITPDPATVSSARSGVADRLAAAQKAETSGTHTASMLNQLAAKARAELAGQGSLDPLSALVLANEKGPGGESDDGYLLTPAQLQRATQILGTMNGTDQAAFQQLLAGAKSPDEAAYLYKALAAGHSVAEVQQFDGLIHGHGDDPTWLSDHLVPAFSTPDTGQEGSGQTQLTYLGQSVDTNGDSIYNQGGVNDCVAASTVVAQAGLDPVLMLQLTTGNTPDAPGADSVDNMQKRLQQTYVANYLRAQKADGYGTYPTTDKGVWPTGETLLANQDLGAATGNSYQYVSLGSDGDRQAALGRIEQSVDAGQPVPIDVTDGKEGHQMMIIGRDGDRLEVYNPWGFTSWVTEDQFMHSQLGGLTPGAGLNTADGLELPK